MRRVSKIAYLLVTFFLGALGIHRFMTGRFWTGLLYLLTGGLFLFGVLYDFIVGILKPSIGHGVIEF